MMMPSNLAGDSSSAKHHQQLIQPNTMLTAPYSFLPTVFGSAQLDMPLLRSADPHHYLNQLAAMSQEIVTQNCGNCSERHDDAISESGKAEAAASTSSETVSSSCNDDSPASPRLDRAVEQEMRLHCEQTAESSTLSPHKMNNENSTLTSTHQNDSAASTTSGPDFSQMDLSKLISDFLPGLSNGAAALSMAALTQRMPLVFDQMQLMNQYLSPGTVEDTLRVLTALGNVAVSSNSVPSASNNSSTLLSSPFASSASHSKDTYCEMCDKNFCNRYFLRTHKWKKHGVPLPDKNSPSEYNMPLLASPTASQNYTLDLPTTSTGINITPVEILAALCSQSGLDQISPSKTSSQPTSVIVNCSSNSESPSSKRARMDDEASKEDDEPPNLARSGSDKVDDEPLISNATQLPNTDDLIAMIARQAHENAFAQDAVATFGVEGVQVPQKSSPSKQSKEACEMCGQEYESRAGLQQHLLLQHNILNNLLTPFGLLPLAPLQAQQQHQQGIHGADTDRARNTAIVPAVITTPSASRQPKKQYSTGKNYCDVCNKEVCNKYFLRTHMLKMHGIVIDEHKTIIANIDTLEKEKSGTIAFRCDICNMNVGQTRESLKQHKQEVHNVVSLPTPRAHRGSVSSIGNISSTSTLSQALRVLDQSDNYIEQMRCPICNIQSAGIMAMQKHFSDKHRLEMNLESLESFLKDTQEMKTRQRASAPNESFETDFQQQSESQDEFSCSHCTEVFSDQVHFQLHMIHNHPMVVRNSEKLSNSPVTTHEGEPLYTQCDYQSPDMTGIWTDHEEKLKSESADVEKGEAALRAEENISHRENSRKWTRQGMYDCPISWCPRRYRNPAILSKHVAIIHRWRLKFSMKSRKDKPRVTIAARKVKWKKRYVCLFYGCKSRFWSRADCNEHILSHFPESGIKNTDLDSSSPVEAQVVNGKIQNGKLQKTKCHQIGAEKGRIVDDLQNCDNRKDQERNSHTPGSSSSDSDVIPAGYGRPSRNAKPYTVQTFLMREQAPDSSSAEGNSASGAVFSEMVAHLPVRNTVREMVRVNMELVPTAQQISPVMHL